MRRFVLVLVLAIVSSSHAAHAEPVLDVVLDGEGTGSGQSFVEAPREFAQAFTVGVAGVLTRIDVKVRGSTVNASGLRWRIVPLEEDGSPIEDSGLALAAGQIPIANVVEEPAAWDWAAIENLAIPVEVGDRFAIVLTYTDAGAYSWLIATEGRPGESFCRGACGEQWTPISVSGYRIRTWVDDAIERDAFAETLAAGSGQSFLESFIPNWAQTFVPSRDGTLARFDLLLRSSTGSNTDAIVWRVLPLDQDGSPVEDAAQALASGTIAGSSVSLFPEDWQWIAVEGLDVPVSQGVGLAVALSLPPTTTSSYSLRLAGLSDPGEFAFCRRESPPPCGAEWTNINNAFQFRTFLRTVPEPAAATAGLAALLALSCLRGRRDTPLLNGASAPSAARRDTRRRSPRRSNPSRAAWSSARSRW